MIEKNFTEGLAAVFGEENASRNGCDNKKFLFYSCQVVMLCVTGLLTVASLLYL